MATIRNILGLGDKSEGDKDVKPDLTRPGVFKVTITGPAKGPKPISFEIESTSAKQAQKDVLRVFNHGKVKIEAA